MEGENEDKNMKLRASTQNATCVVTALRRASPHTGSGLKYGFVVECLT